MKHLKSIIAVLVFTLTFSFSQAQKKIKLENSVLWKIEHSELKEPSYVLGTLHVMCKDDFEISKKITQTLQNVDALVLEINLSDPKEIKAMQELMKNPKKISDELSEQQFEELDTLVTNVMGVPLSNFDSYGLSILNTIMIQKMLPCKEIKSLEMELMTLATEKQKSIYSLEKVAEQMEIMRTAYPTDFALKQILLFESYKKDFGEAIIAYNNEDITTAVDLVSKDIYMDENATTIMQINRNKNWVEKMPEMMTERSNLFAVGAAHLTHDYGIIHLLRQKGYTVTPVFN
ncbi:TraB/GumN family protein [Winogradskyella undariae]|uniref:TraB/GumN family protein n=1 Tax=Winogradskyella undariae TaxID=1285465 RepID=UPI0015CDFB39|nr:TraB/GumN family protein [Winogradskyella undariae]